MKFADFRQDISRRGGSEVRDDQAKAREGMKSWKCSTQNVNGPDRKTVWDDALRHISLPGTRLHDNAGFHGDVTSVVSPLGIEFSRVAASAQTLSGRCDSRAPCLWLALPVKGRFRLGDDATGDELHRGDILYGPAGCDSTLKLPDQFVMLYIRIPQAMLHPRLLNVRLLQTGLLAGSAAVNRIFSGLLCAVVDELDALTDDDIHPLEVALSEFVIASLGAKAASGCFDAAGASNFHRVCQTIDAQLGDGDLSLQRIADTLHVSARYIQKLFQQTGQSFSLYVHRRRLANCRADLANPALRGLSISDICFRWGFNDAAHFSRSFRADFGVSPRSFRQGAR
jgi:AraC-like DNA-binding protein